MRIHFNHHWVAVAVDRVAEAYFFQRGSHAGEKFGEDAPITEVLQKCSDCGKFRTTTLDGHWKLEELK